MSLLYQDSKFKTFKLFIKAIVTSTGVSTFYWFCVKTLASDRFVCIKWSWTKCCSTAAHYGLNFIVRTIRQLACYEYMCVCLFFVYSSQRHMFATQVDILMN